MKYTHLLERFLCYTKTYSESSLAEADKGIIPSTLQQLDFAHMLADEMKTAGLAGSQVTENCYLYGYVPASAGFEMIPPFCLLAHLDTVEEVPGKNVQPVIHEQYDGTAITLKNGLILDTAYDKALAEAGCEHDTIITSDGTTLLGADDKAGIAEIMTAVEYITSHPDIKHGKIEVIFSPDEETGHGMDKVPLNLLSSKRAYTVDGGHIGQLETECFNAAGTTVEFTGKSTHTGNARAAGMINAVTMASAFVRSLPSREVPETTDGREGFFAPMEINGTIEKTTVSLILRDFNTAGLERRKLIVDKLAEAAAVSYGGKVSVTHKMQYLNMKDGLEKDPAVVNDLIAAYNTAGIVPVFTPIRGGTDGSRLTEMGIPTPNIFTGGHNYHSRFEWISLNQMEKTVDVLLALAKIIASSTKGAL